jgi:transcriptional antiterminator RfaH
VVRSEPNRETVAAHFLGLNGFATYLPRIRVARVQQGRRMEIAQPLFPNYLFFRVDGDWGKARRCFGISSIVMSGDEPGRLPDNVIDLTRERARDGYIELEKSPPRFRPGDSVRVTRGPMEGVMGLFDGLRGSDRVAVLLTFLGGQRATVLPVADVEPTSKPPRFLRTPWMTASRREQIRRRRLAELPCRHDA